MDALTSFTRFRLLLLFGLLLFPALFVACGGDDDNNDNDNDRNSSSNNDREDDNRNDDTVAVDEWTEGFCGALVSWQEDLESLSNDLQEEDIDETDGDTIKDLLVQFMEDASSRTSDLKDDIDDLGNPDTDDGEDIQAALSGAIGDVETIFNDTLAEVEDIDSSDPETLATEVTEVFADFESGFTDVADAFTAIEDEYDTSEIDEAAAEIPECEGVIA